MDLKWRDPVIPGTMPIVAEDRSAMRRSLLLNAAVLLLAAVPGGAGDSEAARLELSEAAVNALMNTMAVQNSAQETLPPWSGLTTPTMLPQQPR